MTKYLMIPTDWVLDCVEACRNEQETANKRVPARLDASSLFIPQGSYSGMSIRRKEVTLPDGRGIYQDTNNSEADFEVIPHSL